MDANLKRQLDNFEAAVLHRNLEIKAAARCEARQYSDQMACRCGLTWDTNDPEPPVCRATGERPSD